MKRFAALAALCFAACAPTPPPQVALPAPVAEAAQPATHYAEPAVVLPFRADYVLVDKSDRSLTLFNQGTALKTYTSLQFGDAPIGHKHFQGDERTPEGLYTIHTRNPNSAYHLSLRVSYPNANDRAFAAKYGRSPGGDIFLHGQPNGLTSGRVPGDWTDGCIAFSNDEIEELWEAIADGTPIEIRP